MAYRHSFGGVLVEGDDILGNGVNIAARVEGIAEPGGICISEDAVRQVRGKVAAEFANLGEQTLKNITRPLRVYRARQRFMKSKSPKPEIDPSWTPTKKR
jgi:class 3 adenylate cyclase